MRKLTLDQQAQLGGIASPTAKEKEIVRHLDELMRLAGLGRGEMDTVQLVGILQIAARRAQIAYEASSKDGLGLDCRWHIARAIADTKEAWNERKVK